MKIKITGRAGIEAYAKQPFSPKTALISITDSGGDFARLQYEPEYLLQLQFDDITSQDAEDEFERHAGRRANANEKRLLAQKFHMISEAQAREIAAFVYKIKEDARLLLCQCEYGESRSAAVAAAVIEHFQGCGIIIFADDRYYPNKQVYRMVYRALCQLDATQTKI